MGEGLTEQQRQFLQRYVISSGRIDTTDYDSLDRKERGTAAGRVADTILKDCEDWTKRLSGLKDANPQDRLLNSGWMDRDAKALRKMLDEAAPFLTTEQRGACDTALRRLTTQAEGVRTALSVEVQREIDHKVGSVWPRMARDAEGKSRKDLLHVIEEIEAEMSDLRLSAGLANVSAGPIEGFAPEVARLRKLYEASVPAFTGKVEEVKFEKVSEPKLTYGDAVCEEIFALYGRSWNDVKKAYRTPAFLDEVEKRLKARPKDGTEAMWQLWAFRKKHVDMLIAEVAKEAKLPGLGTGYVAVGSTNLESDYDLTVMQHGETLEDWQIVKEFNARFKSKFKVQPGTIFDTNLYASAPPRARMSDNPTTPEQKAMQAMERSGQDVGALMKQRRFMSWEEYEGMMNAVLDEMEASGARPEAVKATRTQFEEADVRYQMSVAGTIRAGLEALQERVKTGAASKEEESAAKRIEDLLKRAEKAAGAEANKLILEANELLSETGDVMLEVTNALYVKSIEDTRKLEAEAVELERQMREVSEQIEKLPETADPEQRKALEEKLGKLRSDFEGRAALAKDAFTDSVFFANEAYHSAGPFKHIVQATQAVESELKASTKDWDKLDEKTRKGLIAEEQTKRRGGLSLHDCLQSFNEQLGDFVKDLVHHAHAKDEDLPGTGFYRSAKYLERLIDAVDLLEKKVAGGLKVSIPGKLKTLEEYRTAITKGLLALRKGAIAIKAEGDEKAQADQVEAYAIAEIQKMFGVGTLTDLGGLFKSYGAKVNARVRAEIAKEMKAEGGDKAFFSGAKEKT